MNVLGYEDLDSNQVGLFYPYWEVRKYSDNLRMFYIIKHRETLGKFKSKMKIYIQSKC